MMITKFDKIYRKLVEDKPFKCTLCGDQGSLCRIEFDKNLLFIRINCHGCGNLAKVGPFSFEELRQIARWSLREKGYDWSFVWFAFMAAQEIRSLIPSFKDQETHKTWCHVLAEDSKIREGVYAL